jgi:hypothetical protein
LPEKLLCLFVWCKITAQTFSHPYFAVYFCWLTPSFMFVIFIIFINQVFI